MTFFALATFTYPLILNTTSFWSVEGNAHPNKDIRFLSVHAALGFLDQDLKNSYTTKSLDLPFTLVGSMAQCSLLPANPHLVPGC
jgi:hypothetical protein